MIVFFVLMKGETSQQSTVVHTLSTKQPPNDNPDSCLPFMVCACYCAATGGKHELVPADMKADAEQHAKEAIKDSDSEDDD